MWSPHSRDPESVWQKDFSRMFKLNLLLVSSIFLDSIRVSTRTFLVWKRTFKSAPKSAFQSNARRAPSSQRWTLMFSEQTHIRFWISDSENFLIVKLSDSKSLRALRKNDSSSWRLIGGHILQSLSRTDGWMSTFRLQKAFSNWNRFEIFFKELQNGSGTT